MRRVAASSLIVVGVVLTTGLGVLSSATAAALSIAGTFSGSTTNVGTISGTFTLDFDEGVVTGVGLEQFSDEPLTSLSLSPNPIGGTTFDLANSFADIWYDSGALDKVLVGRTPVTSVAAASPDFRAIYDGAGNLLELLVSDGTTLEFATGISGSFSTIPEPSTVPTLSAPMTTALALALLAIGTMCIRPWASVRSA